ncbi:MAG: hypothetical protein H6730_18095 [Deltaproteobacteria bacterium]|nr:hypothetical protein [Deltaproteobacteria bacterium]
MAQQFTPSAWRKMPMSLPRMKGQPQRSCRLACISSSQGERTTTVAVPASRSIAVSSKRPQPTTPTALPQARKPSSKVWAKTVTIDS